MHASVFNNNVVYCVGGTGTQFQLASDRVQRSFAAAIVACATSTFALCTVRDESGCFPLISAIKRLHCMIPIRVFVCRIGSLQTIDHKLAAIEEKRLEAEFAVANSEVYGYMRTRIAVGSRSVTLTVFPACYTLAQTCILLFDA